MQSMTDTVSSMLKSPTNVCPAHWSDKYVGLECNLEHPEDCADFVKRVIQTEWQQTITWPFEDRTHIETCLQHPNNNTKTKTQFTQHTLSYAQTHWQRLDEPKDKVIALMDYGGAPQHVGLVCDFDEADYIAPGLFLLHLWQPAGQVIRLPIPHLKAMGLTVAGYYQWPKQTNVTAKD